MHPRNCCTFMSHMPDLLWRRLAIRNWIIWHRLHRLPRVKLHTLYSHQLVAFCDQIMQHLHDVVAIGFSMGVLLARQSQLSLVWIVPTYCQQSVINPAGPTCSNSMPRETSILMIGHVCCNWVLTRRHTCPCTSWQQLALKFRHEAKQFKPDLKNDKG